MEYLFGIVLVGALAYAGVELVKHFMPSWYDKQEHRWSSKLHDRLDVLEKNVAHMLSSKQGGAND